jgi:hypothetical protein
MHAAVRKYRVSDVDALVEKVEAEFVQRVKEVDGSTAVMAPPPP